MKKKTLVVLAAGIGSRFGGTKQLASVTKTGDTIIDFSLYDAIGAGFSKIVFIVRKEILLEFRTVFDKKLSAKVDVQYVSQGTGAIPDRFLPAVRSKPWGTAHAVLMAKKVVNGNFCVINADDFYGRSAFEQMSQLLDKTDPNYCNFSMVGYPLGNTLSECGSVSRGQCIINEDHRLEKIIERTKIDRNGEEIICLDEGAKDVSLDKNTIVSMNFWGFTDKIFPLLGDGFDRFLESSSNEGKEYLLPTAIGDLVSRDLAKVKVITSDDEWLGVTYKEDRDWVAEQINVLQKRGVYPTNLWK